LSADIYEPPHLTPPPPRPSPVVASRPHRPLWLHILLFGLTFLSAMIANVIPTLPGSSLTQIWAILRHHPEKLLSGLPFALALMSILLAHEMGHYLTARRYGVDQTLPFFIPAPTIFGTLGAIILMRSLPRDRKVLLNVAVAGPFAGMVVALPLTAWGLAHSSAASLERLSDTDFVFGSSILFVWLKAVFGPDASILELHPVAVAGWVGLFVTSLNLIPAAQLDGGHVAYAMFGKRQARLSLAVVVGLALLGSFLALEYGLERGAIWILWAMFLFILGVRHPPVRDERIPLAPGQRAMGWVALVLFLLTFTPTPLSRNTASELEPAIEDERTEPAPPPLPRRRHEGRPAEEFRL
jgi:membrane-associated protease RseP (regulator of RpoE activity)